MIIFGSRAIKKYFTDFREPKDFDFLVEDKENIDKEEICKQYQGRCEFLICPPLIKYLKDNNFNTNEDLYLDANIIYTLKISHIFWDIKWDKHIYDISFLRSKGCILIEPLFTELYEYWKTIHNNNKRINFEKTNEEFFVDKVVRKYEHDFLHNIMKFEKQPSFFKIKKDLSKAEIDKDLFEKQTKDVKFNIVREEAYVLALERYLIPETVRNHMIAYSKILKAMITRLSPLWLAIFIVENYRELYKPNINFYKKFQEYELSTNHSETY